MADLEAGKWYVSNPHPPKGGVQGIGFRPGRTPRDHVMSPLFDTEQQAKEWLDSHPEAQGPYAQVWRNLE